MEAVNGLNVAKFDPTLTASAVGYSLNNLGFGALNTGQYSFAALWKVTNGFPSKARENIAVAFVGTEARAVLREDDSGVPEARVQRATDNTVTIVSIPTPVRIGGWVAAAADYHWTNDTVTIHDLLGSTSVSGSSAERLVRRHPTSTPIGSGIFSLRMSVSYVNWPILCICHICGPNPD
ncbi:MULTISPECIES: hypothetical protein [unclassified Mesorhizobium]|uniref:hypothetical protein n=1 Tax=unclassified Mesorhizobium TaxID=325217 RepID=UPI000FE7DA17|nr:MULTISPECIES: hypothetical protein [unclassified Mesorhizobium]RWB94998.1 MAG: hypothetical protein EOQ57_30685 [Mesorhizobium sp.]TGV18287.1 hypothetical protein EN786_33850 [Mesorhizobium sp. M4B.F.Ca.ET.143.01.1.1]